MVLVALLPPTVSADPANCSGVKLDALHIVAIDYWTESSGGVTVFEFVGEEDPDEPGLYRGTLAWEGVCLFAGDENSNAAVCVRAFTSEAEQEVWKLQDCLA
jgi:hypothetical protein